MDAELFASEFFSQLKKYSNKKRLRTFFLSWKVSFIARRKRINTIVQSIDLRERTLKSKVFKALMLSKSNLSAIGSNSRTRTVPSFFKLQSKKNPTDEEKNEEFLKTCKAKYSPKQIPQMRFGQFLIEILGNSLVPNEFRRKMRSSFENCFAILQEVLNLLKTTYFSYIRKSFPYSCLRDRLCLNITKVYSFENQHNFEINNLFIRFFLIFSLFTSRWMDSKPLGRL